MRKWLFKTPLRSAIFLIVSGVIFTVITIAAGIGVDWDPEAKFGRHNGISGWFLYPAGLTLGIGGMLTGLFELVMVVRERLRPRASPTQLYLPSDDEFTND